MSDPLLSMFSNILYAVELNPIVWVERMEQGCLTLERFFPGSSFMTDINAERPIKNRRKYLQSMLKGRLWGLGLSNGMPWNGGDIQATGYINIRGQIYLGELIYRMRTAIPATTLEMGETVFAAVGDAVQAHCSQVKPYKACGQLEGYNQILYERARQLKPQGGRPDARVEGEKLLNRVEQLGLQLPLINKYPATPHLHRAQPRELGWLNYWSAETCEYLGFPDPERDRDLLAHSYQTPGGGWLVKICPDPLDLDRPDHLALFAELYQRFPKLGLREGTAEPPPTFRYPEHTAYINADDPGCVIERLVPFLQARGYQRVEHFPANADAGGVIIGLICGAPDWTVIKTLPEEFLAEILPNREEPLLIELCREIRRGGFVLNVYNQFEAVLLETDGAGRLSRSGIRDFEALPEDVDFEAMEESENPPLIAFRLLPVEIETNITDIDDYGQIAEQLHELLAGQNADLCGDKHFKESLSGNLWQERQGVKLCFVATQ
jgi:hypothetical protein